MSVAAPLKAVARAVAPTPLRAAWGRFYGGVKLERARRAFDRAGASPAGPLPVAALEQLMARAYQPPDPVRYDPEGLVLRSREKIAQIERVVDLASIGRALELGAWDGMVAAALKIRGVAVAALDVSMGGVDARARAAGVSFLQSDACDIALASGSIDLVYSFASFEHFPRPDRCLSEIERVLRPGGYAFLNFGPLYFSPYGRHAYRQIPVPFCHLLFDEQTLRDCAARRGLPHDWPYVNGWGLRRYRELFRTMSYRLATLRYVEHSTGGVGVELIAAHPALFRHLSSDFDEFLVPTIDIALQKRR
ncbi:MAG: class I SAM-dependent methyltransferase [Acidobacteria bacterium]|nr:class I SAM-dependent methyltransferase [Acidobacteriota bacterium]